MSPKAKNSYRKPVLERVVLVPDENVLAACYDLSGSGAFGNPICSSGGSGGCFGTTL